jgi:LuxR family maltose regulon positive regulatory protein
VIDDPRFTRREIEILRRLAAGEDNRQIAESLFISRETVRWHLRSAYAKLGVHNRNAAASLVRLV